MHTQLKLSIRTRITVSRFVFFISRKITNYSSTIISAKQLSKLPRVLFIRYTDSKQASPHFDSGSVENRKSNKDNKVFALAENIRGQWILSYSKPDSKNIYVLCCDQVIAQNSKSEEKLMCIGAVFQLIS